MIRVGIVAAVLGVSAMPIAARAQVAQGCSLRQDQITERIADRAVALQTGAVIDNVPVTTPEAKQVTAPSASGGESSLADGPDFNKLLGFAVQNGLATQSADGVTFDVNLFALKAAIDHSVIEEQTKYERYALLRRFSGALTFGGKGEPVDLDGDGKLEPAQTPESLSDIVTFDFRVRLSRHSRDRRDPENYKAIQSRVAGSLGSVNRAQGAILSDLVGLGVFSAADCDAQLTARLKTYDEAKLKVLGVALDETAAGYADAVSEIDSRTLWTLALTGTQRHREFGADSVRIGIRGAMGGMISGWTMNFDYGETESLNTSEHPRTMKIAWEWKKKVLGKLTGGTGMDASLSASVEHYQDVPDALHDRVEKLNVRLVYPLSKTIQIPISVTWANHADLLTDESDIRGNIGFTVNFDSLIKPK